MFGSSGERLSRLSHNCFRHNGVGPVGGGVFSSAAFDGEMHGGRIDHNAFYANTFAIRLGGGEQITVAHNRSSLDGVFIRPAFTRALEIVHNRIGSGAASAIWFFHNPMVPQPNTGAVVSHNVVSGRGAHAIAADPAALTDSLISHNTLTNTRAGWHQPADRQQRQPRRVQPCRRQRQRWHPRPRSERQRVPEKPDVRQRRSRCPRRQPPGERVDDNRCQTDFPAASICGG